jgi:hemerythrin-like domain-containing protein
MKRAEALQPLSREHLTALLAAKKLREADDVAVATRDFLAFWNEDGRRHFRIEEEVLLPGWAAYGEVDHDGVVRMLEEHLTIRREALRLQAGELSLRDIHNLGVLLHDHVRFEERELFVVAEAALDPAALDLLAAAIEAAEADGARCRVR